MKHEAGRATAPANARGEAALSTGPAPESAIPTRRTGTVLERRADGRLRATLAGRHCAVRVRRCFPWSEPARFLSLRDDNDEEFAFIADPHELDAASRRALEEAMIEAGFVFEVIRVLRIVEEVELRHWRVETRQGTRAFQTRLDDWPQQLPHGGLLIRDVTGDLYHLTEPARLDRESRALLGAFID
jgi:hypothetical protein